MRKGRVFQKGGRWAGLPRVPKRTHPGKCHTQSLFPFPDPSPLHTLEDQPGVRWKAGPSGPPTGHPGCSCSPACTWAVPALNYMSPTSPVTSGDTAPGLSLGCPSVHPGVTPKHQDLPPAPSPPPPTAGRPQRAPGPRPVLKLTLTPAWPGLSGALRTRPALGNKRLWEGGGCADHRAHPIPPRLFVFVTNSIFKTRPAAAELSGSPFLCLCPPLRPSPPLTNRAILMENSLVWFLPAPAPHPPPPTFPGSPAPCVSASPS